jgi:hypothetical protein
MLNGQLRAGRRESSGPTISKDAIRAKRLDVDGIALIAA